MKKDSIYNDSFIYYGDNKIYAYAVEQGQPVYKHSKKDVLLIKTEYNYNGYYVYEKYPENKDFSYYINHIEQAESLSLISYQNKKIPINIQLSNFIYTDKDYGFESVYLGYMAYYLLIKENGFLRKFEGSGNVTADMFLIEGNYLYKEENLSDTLMNMYSDFFELQQ